jgi:acetylornithine deacetylase/succinyl-diaminopimelate desuccinylase-like protein
MPVETIRPLVEGLMADAIEDLAALVRIPSCAFPGFPPEPVLQTADAVVNLLERYGVPAPRLLEVPSGYPAVFAEAPPPPGAPTILLYAHYDIQPAPVEQGWDVEPFEPVIGDGRIYGRGAADDKSGVMIIASTLRLFSGQFPVGIKVLIEGEEETGSNLEALVAANPDLVRCDAFIINDGGNMKNGQPELTVALRGIAACDVTVRSLRAMAHSGSYGGAAPDALMALIRILDSLLDDNGNVAVKDLTSFEWEGADIPEAEYREAAGLLPDVELMGNGTLASRLWAHPSVTAIGLDAPPTAGASNSLIPEAKARISLRLAPGSDPEESMRRLMDHIHAAAPWGVKVITAPVHTGDAFLGMTSGPVFAAAQAAAADAFGVPPRVTGSGGTIPLLTTLQRLAPDAEFVIWGPGDERSQVHAANESLDLGELQRMIVAEALLLERLGGAASEATAAAGE